MPDPLEVLRTELARRRDAGVAFERAWAPSLAVVEALPVDDVEDRDYALAAASRTIEAWRAGYQRAPATEAEVHAARLTSFG